ncbi:MAG TPA: prolyl oligopeptidase family serine peptidase, partial [Thermoanaerobaculia bacterium]
MTAPIAKKIPETFELHGDTRTDDYGWLRDKSSPDVLAYLEAENAYAAELTKDLAPLREALYAEMLGRIRQTDSNPPYRKGAHWYYSRTEEGKQYPIYARRASLEGAEEVLLDVNELAAGHEFMALGALAVSDDGHLLAYTTDDTGYRQYRLHVKDLRSGETLPDTAERVGAVEWAADNATLIYAAENDAKRQCCIYRKVLGAADDVLVYEDGDELYDVWVERSRSGAVLFIISDSKTTSEVRVLRASDPDAEPVVIAPRRDDHQYYAEHHGDRLYILTNDTGLNSRLVWAPLRDPSEANWVEVIPHRQPVRLERVDAFRDHLVVTQRENGLTQLRILDLRTNDAHFIAFDEPAYALAPSHNEEFDTNVFRFAYESLVTPKSIYDYDLDSRRRTLLKRTEVLGGFDPENYRSERIFATASDGARIPIALVHHKDVDPRGVNPLELYAYGSYGVSIPTNFSSTRLSLLDRGFVFAIAHIRGGGELGREWYDDGRMTKKTNTFTDFIAAAEHLIAERYTSPDKL